MHACPSNQLSAGRSRRRLVLVVVGVVVMGGIGYIVLSSGIGREVRGRLGRATVTDRLAEIGPRVEPLWRSRLEKAGLSQLPTQLTLVILKARRELVVFAPGPAAGNDVEIGRFAVTAASGGPGPKLREGDNQVPEGFYRIESLNPNSRYHVALRVNYPSADDRQNATADGRDPLTLGSDIMIHGGAASIGCVALGDPAIEELFWLVAGVGYERVELVFVPDVPPFSVVAATDSLPWLAERYRELEARLTALGLSAAPIGK